jgi:flavin-dependent dehydrogenase
MHTEELIVGAGPIGLFLGTKSKDSTIIDMKKNIGERIQCTGVLTNEIEKFLTQKELKSITKNIITQTTIKGPTQTLQTTIKKNYIIDNKLFEELLYNKAIKNNNEIILNTKYLGSKNSKHTIKSADTRNEKQIFSDNIIGADGPHSFVARQHKLRPVTKTYTGLQVRLRVKEHENSITFFPHIGVYAWYVPEDEHYARVGLATTSKQPQKLLQTFLKQFQGKTVEQQVGIIPIHRPFRQTSTKHCTLLGDSAGHAKNTTGGGIIMGMKAVENHHAKKQAKPSVHKHLHAELYTHFLVHNTLQSANRQEWDFIIKNMAKTDVLSKNNRDNLLSWGPRLASKPSLFGFCAKKILTGHIALR